jgi:hypothetical protein
MTFTQVYNALYDVLFLINEAELTGKFQGADLNEDEHHLLYELKKDVIKTLQQHGIELYNNV